MNLFPLRFVYLQWSKIWNIPQILVPSGFPPLLCNLTPGPLGGPEDTPAPDAEKNPPVNHWGKDAHRALIILQDFFCKFLLVQCLSSRCTICPGQSCSVSGAQGPISHPELFGEEFSGLPPYSPWWAAHRSQWMFPHQLNIMTEYQFNHLFWHP